MLAILVILKMFNTENRLNLSVDAIIGFHDGEVGSAESIAAENIIAIGSNPNKSLCLKIKR